MAFLIKRKFNLIKNIIFSNFQRSHALYKVSFALTYKCNLRCKICRNWQKPYKEELCIQEIEKIFKNFNDLGWLDLTGGEITLREDLIEIAKVIIKNANALLIFHVSSNGQLPEKLFLIANEILRAGLILVINIGIDGPREINDGLRGVNGAYLKSLETFKLLKKLPKVYCYLSCTISDYNVNYLNNLIVELYKDLPSFSPSDLHFNIFHQSTHYYTNQDMNCLSGVKFGDIKEYLTMCKKGNFIKGFLEGKYLQGLSEYLKGNRFFTRCEALKSTCFINPYGEVYPCGTYDMPLGSLKNSEYNIEKLWHNATALELKKRIKDKNCPGCWSPCEAYPAILANLINSIPGAS